MMDAYGGIEDAGGGECGWGVVERGNRVWDGVGVEGKDGRRLGGMG